MDVTINQFLTLYQPSLDFKVSLQKPTQSTNVKYDIELTSETSSPHDKKSLYEKYNAYNYTEKPSYEPAQELKQINPIESSSSEYDLREAAHPFVCLFTIFFKLTAGLIFLFQEELGKDKIIVYILVVVLLCFDFWVTKNISGRLLVGLRWNNQFDEEGNEVWVYESHPCAEASNRVDKAFFWTSLSLSFIFWILMLVGEILTFKFLWISLTGFAFILTMTNICGYYKCRGNHQKRVRDMQRELTKKGLNVVGMVMLKNNFS